MTRDHGVLVAAESGPEGLTPATRNVMASAASLARSVNHPLMASLMGRGVTHLAGRLFDYGAQTVYVVDHPLLENFQLEVHARALRKVVEEVAPGLVIIPQTSTNRELAPYLALSLHGAVVTNCVRLSYDGTSQRLEALCPVMGGAAKSVYRFEGDGLKVVGFQPQEAEEGPGSIEATGEVVTVDAGLEPFSPRSRVVQCTLDPGPKLEDAKIVAAGGRGLGAKENFHYIEELAEALGGLPAASRAIVDLGWATPAQQVGLTGKVVSPDLYFAIGISGASQHMVGCSTAKTIVAINNDSESHIFPYARYGVVADCLEFLPVFIEECRKLRDSQ